MTTGRLGNPVAILEQKVGLYFVGFVRYEDSVGTRRETSFVRKFHGTNRFLPISDPDNEYED